MIMEGCQGKPRTPTISEKICPNCGNPIEIFSTDTQVACDKCGFVVYNDTLSCVQWCKYARKCVGDEMYERMMEIARRQKEEAAAARKAKQEAQHAEKNRPFHGICRTRFLHERSGLFYFFKKQVLYSAYPLRTLRSKR